MTGVIPPRVEVTLPIAPDVLDAYRALGEDWQEKMHHALVVGLNALPAQPRRPPQE